MKNEILRQCYVCWRPFQLLNVINYILQVDIAKEKKQRVLFLSDVFKKNQVDSDELKKYFIEIHFFREEEERPSYLKNVFRLINPRIIIKENLIDTKVVPCLEFDEIIGTGYHLFFVAICNINQEAKLIKLEDGCGSYINDESINYNRYFVYKAEKIFKRGPLSICFKEVYLYCPELILINYHNTVIKKLPNINNIFDILKKVFFFKNNPIYSSTKLVYLTNPFEDKEKKMLEKMVDLSNNIILRRHPSELYEIKNWKKIDYINNIWELQCSEISEETILISNFSTAQIMPYIMFNKHCNLIFLYKLFDSNILNAKYKEFIEKLKTVYMGKISTPQTTEEFLKIIKLNMKEV